MMVILTIHVCPAERQYGDEEFDPSAAVPDAGDPPPALPDDVDLEEQKMLMAAMLGQAYEGPVPGEQHSAIIEMTC